jgi:hypothetical protein
VLDRQLLNLPTVGLLSKGMEVRTELNLNQRFSAPRVKHNGSEVEGGSRCNEGADVRSWQLPVEKGVAWKALSGTSC